MADVVPILSNFDTLGRAERLLLDPSGDASLDELKRDLNDLAKLRVETRLAFCKRLALAYMILVGHPPAESTGAGRADARAFQTWCANNLRTANNKSYSIGTLRQYVSVGFDANPALRLKRQQENDRKKSHKSHQDAKRGRLVGKAIEADKPVKAILRRNVSSDVSSEINALMTAWEAASPLARKHFMYSITGMKFD
jgi:hypothetical protein